MKSVHITEKTLKGLTPGVRISMVLVWVIPLVVLLATFRWYRPCVGLRLLCKSTWVLYAGVLLSCFPLSLVESPGKTVRKWVIILCVLAVLSLFLLPFGLIGWDFRGSYAEFGPDPFWHYGESLLSSFLIHIIPIAIPFILTSGDSSDIPSYDGSWQPDSGRSESGSGIQGEHTWLDDVWKGGQISDDYYGRHGEFDSNDEARRISEDMQQFHRSHPDAELSDHYNWEDVLDAETDGYLDEE